MNYEMFIPNHAKFYLDTKYSTKADLSSVHTVCEGTYTLANIPVPKYE